MIYSDGQLIMRHHSVGSLSWNTVERWEGGAVITLSRHFLLQNTDCITINEEENVIKAGPYKLEVLEWHYGIDRILAVRQTGLKTKVFVVRYKLKKLWLEVYHRLILFENNKVAQARRIRGKINDNPNSQVGHE